MDGEVYLDLQRIQEGLYGCWMQLRFKITKKEILEKTEQETIVWLSRLKRLAELHDELKSLVYLIEEAFNTFDVNNVINELDRILGGYDG